MDRATPDEIEMLRSMIDLFNNIVLMQIISDASAARERDACSKIAKQFQEKAMKSAFWNSEASEAAYKQAEIANYISEMILSRKSDSVEDVILDMIEPDPYDQGKWRPFFQKIGQEKFGFSPCYDVPSCTWQANMLAEDLRRQAKNKTDPRKKNDETGTAKDDAPCQRKTNAERHVFEIKHAMFEADHESPSLLDVDSARQTNLYFSDLFPGVSWTWYAMDHLMAPNRISIEEDNDDESLQRLDRSNWASHLRSRQKTPDPKMYSVRIIVEYEPVDQDLARAIIRERYEKSQSEDSSR